MDGWRCPKIALFSPSLLLFSRRQRVIRGGIFVTLRDMNTQRDLPRSVHIHVCSMILIHGDINHFR